MKSEIYSDVAIERAVKARFGMNVDIEQVIVRQADVSRTAQATVFLTKKKQLLLYVDAHSKLLLGDVQKIVTRMGLKAELYIPPKGQPDYFDRIGRQKFREVFPGRDAITNNDVIFYRTLAPYHPALVLVKEVKNGEVYCYDSDAHSKWRVAAKFDYRRIKTG